MYRKSRLVLALAIVLAVSLFFGLTLPAGELRASEEEKHVLRVGVVREIESLNPMIAWSYQAYEVMHLNYNLLVTWDEDLNTAPSLAKDWEPNEDGSEWTFYLEEDVTWHDGEPFTSADVKFSFEYMRDNELGYFTDYVEPMADINTPDEHTVVITMTEPLAWMPDMWVPIIPKHIWENVDPEEAGSTYESPVPVVGTGPFQTVEYRMGEYLRMEANKDYFKGAPQIDEIVFITYANAPVMAEALKLGEVDIITEVPGAQFKSLEGEPDIVTVNATSPSFSQIAINSWDDPDSQGNPLLLDKNVRLAIDHAVDRQHLIDAVSFGYGESASTLVPPFYDYWHLELDASELREFDLDKARQILEDAGYVDDGSGVRMSPDGEPLAFNLLLRSESPEGVNKGNVIKEWLDSIGMDITVEVLDDGALTDRIYDYADFDMFMWGWYVDIDPSSILRILTTDQIWWWNETYYSNPEYDELYALHLIQMDPEERQETIHKMQRIAYEDAPYIILAYDPELQAYRTDRFEGWVRTPDDGPVVFAHNVYTYENLRPISGDAQPAPDEGEGADDAAGSLWPWLLGAVAIIAVVMLVRKKKESA